MAEIDLSNPKQSEQYLAECRKLVERVLASSTFLKSPRLKSFLSFICSQVLDENSTHINEQQIGVQVFGRDPSYNTGDDSIVRSQARFLRQRLEEYFKGEGSKESIQIQIPKGSYVPVFVQVELPAPLVEEKPEPAATAIKVAPTEPVRESRGSYRWLQLSAVVIILLLIANLWAFYSQRSGRKSLASHPLWSAFFDSGRQVIIVPSDSTLILLEELSKKSFRLSDYVDRNAISKIELPKELNPLTAASVYSHQYTSIADLDLAVRFSRLPEASRANIEIRYARDLRMGDLKEANVVLIGGARANPWVELFEGKTSFSVAYDPATARNVVAIRSPHPGEASSYQENSSDPEHRAYGVVAFLPGLDGEGNAMLVEGTSMAGTESASDFLFNPSSFAAFSKQIGVKNGKLPHFEVLLETRSIGGNAPQSRVIAYRVLP